MKQIFLLLFALFLASCGGKTSNCQEVKMISEWNQTTIALVRTNVLESLGEADDAIKKLINNAFDNYDIYLAEISTKLEKNANVPDVKETVDSYNNYMITCANSLLTIACTAGNEKDAYKKIMIMDELNNKLGSMTLTCKKASEGIEILIGYDIMQNIYNR